MVSNDKLSRRKFLGATAAGMAGTAALTGEAAAHSVGDPIFTTTDLNIRDSYSTSASIVKTADAYTGMEIIDGPYYNDGWKWWYLHVNGDSSDDTKVHGYAVEEYTGHATFAYPCNGRVISTYWDWRDGGTRRHRAMDISNDVGTPVYAARGGTVSRAEYVGGYGYVVYIDHESGYQTRYAHMTSDLAVYAGQDVAPGQHIGYLGCSGSCEDYPHVHFEILRWGDKLDWDMDQWAYLWKHSGVEKNFDGLDPVYL